MTHGDDNGLVLPPDIAPVQAVIIPVASHKPGVIEKATELKEMLAKNYRVKLDDSDNSPGWKFAEYEMKGVPLRIEIGPRDIENNQCVVAMRVGGEKVAVSLDEINLVVGQKLEEIRALMYKKALENREHKTYCCKTMDEIKDTLAEKGDGFVMAMWCGDEECEDKVKEITGVGSRCIPFDQKNIDDKCVCCGKPATCMVCWGKAY